MKVILEETDKVSVESDEETTTINAEIIQERELLR